MSANTLVRIRLSAPSDADGLVRLYSRMSDDDLHLRFFSVYHPPRQFLEATASISQRGGCGVVAVRAGQGEEDVVGEASYFIRADGEGEFSMAVDTACRGGLGRRLFEALLGEASARGLTSLQGEVLRENGAMLGVIRHHPFATLENTDDGTVRVIVSTDGQMPSWPGGEQRRVLIETPGGWWFGEQRLRTDGAITATCRGPGRWVCPVMDGGRCPLADGADAIVFGLNDCLDGHRLLAAHLASHPGSVSFTGGGQPAATRSS